MPNFSEKGHSTRLINGTTCFGDYSVVADLPAIVFAKDLLKCYLDAKVVLVNRDMEKWYKSFNEGIIEDVFNPVTGIIARNDSHFIGELDSTAGRWKKGWFGAQSKIEMQEKAREKYREHYALVERLTRKERLLQYRLDQGWEPLCEFMNRPIPDVDFPRVNEAAALKEKIGLIARRGIYNALRSSIKVIIPLAASTLAWWVVRTQRRI